MSRELELLRFDLIAIDIRDSLGMIPVDLHNGTAK